MENISLSKKQQQIVNSNSKYISVIAGAGSGKTRVVTERIIKRCDSLKHNQKILAITFSNKAADELKDRLYKRLGEVKAKECVYVGTIHNLCNEIICEYGTLINLPNNFTICSSNEDRFKVFLEAIRRVPLFLDELNNLGYDKDKNKKIQSVLDAISIAKRDLRFFEDYRTGQMFDSLFQEYDIELGHQGMIDFDDILRYAYKVLVYFPEVKIIYQSIFKEIYVDEAQDINFSQFEIIKLLAGEENGIIMVGDPNQAIYHFSGGSSDFFISVFPKLFKVETIQLDENFRSSSSVIEAANLLEPENKAKVKYPIKGEFAIRTFSSDTMEAIRIVEKMKSLEANGHKDLDDGAFDYSKCAVIARNRYVFKCLIDELEKNSIKYQLKASPKGAFSSESDFMKMFELSLIVKANQCDTIHLQELQRFVPEHTIKSLNDFFLLTGNGKYELMAQLIAKVLKEIDESNVDLTDSFDKLREVYNDQFGCSEEEKEMMENDIVFWKQNWERYVLDTDKTERTFSNFIRKLSLMTFTEESDGSLTLSTVHMSKGLEFDVVFVIGLCEGVFPDYRAIQNSKNDNGSELREEKHNLFVAITRAKRLCYLSYPRFKTTPWNTLKQQEPSRFLKVFPQFKN